MKNKILIEVSFDDGLQMENNLNKAIDELGSVLKRKGLVEMDLTGLDEGGEIYKISVEINNNQ